MAVAHIFLESLKDAFEPQILEQIATEATIKKFYKGDILLEPGQYIRSTLIVIEGLLKVVRKNQDEDGEYFMYFIKEHEACALSMMCATQYRPSEVKVEADQDTTAIQIPLSVTESWLGSFPSWYKYVISTYRSRFDEVLHTLDQVAFRALDERLEFYLRRLKKANNAPIIEKTHQEIAMDLNSSREVISRLLKKMEQKNILRLGRNQITLLSS